MNVGRIIKIKNNLTLDNYSHTGFKNAVYRKP